MVSPKLKNQVKELIEVTPAVIGKRVTVSEPAFAIQAQRRLESGSASGLETQAVQTAPASFTNDVLEEQRGDALAQMFRVSSHRFQFASSVAKLL